METQRFSIEQFEELLKQHKPYLLMVEQELDKFIEQNKNGIISFDIRVYRGKATDVVVKYVKRIVL